MQFAGDHHGFNKELAMNYKQRTTEERVRDYTV